MCADFFSIRQFQSGDLERVAALFADTVRSVNLRDYTPAQVEAWARGADALRQNPAFFTSLYTLTAWRGEELLGYGNVRADGYLDHLFVHKDFQGRGIAAALCGRLEAFAKARGAERMTVYASLTAKPFFEKRGYLAGERQCVALRGEVLARYVMEKPL